MQDQDRLRAHARGFFVLIRPASVVSERASAEELGIVGGRLIGEQDQHLALDVHTLVIVPVKFRRDDAMPDEDRFGVELIGRFLQLAFADEIVQPFEGYGLIRAYGGKCGVGRSGDADHRDALEIGVVFAGRFGACERELRRDIVRRQFTAARSHAAPFQQIARQELHVLRACVRPKYRSEHTPWRLPAVSTRISS